MAFFTAMPFHKGEQQMHKLLHVPDHDNPTSGMLTPQAVFTLQRAPLLAIGTLDSQGRPWTTLWGGHAGFSEPLGGGIIGTRTIVDGTNDPVVQALVGSAEKGEMIQGNQKMVSGLTIDLMTRKRVKLFGRMLAGALGEVSVENEEGSLLVDGAPEKQEQIQLITKIEQSLGNCPKYLNQYKLRPTLVNSKLVSQGPALSPEAKALIKQADMFFLSSGVEEDMDTNHRGGPPGFVRVLSDTEIVYPEYSGNRLYQSLGNLLVNPRIGITFPNFEIGDVLYVTGTVDVLVQSDAAALLPGSNIAVKIKVDDARFVDGGLPFRGTRKVPSPYNPLVRTLATEGNIKAAIASSRKTARLTKKTLLTPTTARFTFSVSDSLDYSPGQWVAFDFSEHLNYGYSHMRDDDPRSLNDDFVRTFTISSTPKAGGAEFEITIRNVGVVTNYLFRQNDRADFEVPVVGIGGDFKIEQKHEMGKLTPFVAGGVGITPLLGQLEGLAVAPEQFKLLWTIRSTDVDLVLDILRRRPDLAKCTEVFFTGTNRPQNYDQKIAELKLLGAGVEQRRIQQSDLDSVDAPTWYLCAGNPLRKELLAWLDGKVVVYENFDY
ncbi:oxidoreductase-like protein [Lentithecium fluviatile CBS 122367]|uniref:Oxidoreductase-like protein n=1 Tax=Lentithecium fluviatile CBS 122367 TaxID=1168545 RepID=A0A6G1INC9_9PLEO|nr:oxidoreductase-like protein [Lentithecium fluviatile CBS 122367]